MMLKQKWERRTVCRVFVLIVALVTAIYAATGLHAADTWTPSYGWYNGAGHHEGTSADPYQISTADGLAGLAALVNCGSEDFSGKNILLTVDLDLGKKEWQPVGWMVSYGNLRGFAGTFNGGGHKITGLQISTGDNLIKGKSSKIDSNGTVSNTTGLFGYLSPAGTVKNVHLEGSVTNKVSQGAAGLVGWADGVVKNCVVSCDIDASGSGRSYAGEVASLQGNNKSYITNCITYGTVKSTVGAAYSGGIAGFGYWYMGNLLNCTAMCSSLTSTMDAGGIYGGFNVRVTADSVSTCDLVKGAGNYSGGIVGAFGLGYQNCYWLKTKDTQPDGAVSNYGDTGKITDATALPAASAIIDAADLKTIKVGTERDIHVRTYPPTASNAHVKYNWSVDAGKLEITGGQGTAVLKVKARTTGAPVAFADISVDVAGMLGHTVSSDNRTYISNFNTVLTPEGSIKISSGAIKVESISVSGLSSVMQEGEKRRYAAVCVPSDADDQSVKWSISNVEGDGASAADVKLTPNSDGSVTVQLVKGHASSASYTLTATANDGGSTGSIVFASSLVTGEDISGIVPVGDVVTADAEALKPRGVNSSSLKTICTAINTDISSFRINSKGIVFLKDNIAEKASENAAQKENLSVVKVIHMPLFTVATSEAQKLAVCAFIMSGDQLLADKAQNVRVAEMTPDGTGTFLTYAAGPESYNDGHFTIQNMDDSVMQPGDKIDSAASYKLVVYVKDNGGYDLDKADRCIVTPLAIVQTKQKDPEHSTDSGSGGGCSAGFGALALLLALPLVLRKKQK